MVQSERKIPKDAPVIAIDGPSASGKGTVAMAVALQLGLHYLDSGAIYRVIGLAASRTGLDLDQESAIAAMSLNIKISFINERVFWADEDVTDAIRTEPMGAAASRVAAHPGVRQAVLQWQRDFCKSPGLVADGRDMGSVVFPAAKLKIFLTASVEARALRRYKQLKSKGLDANIDSLLLELTLRDQRDSERAVAPLQRFADAIEVDTTQLSVVESVGKVLLLCEAAGIRSRGLS
jgi:cytidylate kinase